MRLGRWPAPTYEVDSIPTGSLGTRYCARRGRHSARAASSKFFGPESSGKKNHTDSWPSSASAQSHGGTAGHSSIGRACARFRLYAEEGSASKSTTCWSLATRYTANRRWKSPTLLVRSRARFGLWWVVDLGRRRCSTPKAEKLRADEMGDQHMGLAGAASCRRPLRKTDRQHQAIEYHRDFHQIRFRMKNRVVMVRQSRGPPPAATPLKFYSSVRMDIRRIGAIKNGEGKLVGFR